MLAGLLVGGGVMLFDLNGSDGEWFQFFTSRLDDKTGEVIYDLPTSDARIKIRGLAGFLEQRIVDRKRVVEHVLNPRTRSMERISYIPDLSPEEAKTERENAWDYCITAWENFKDKATGEVIPCTRENKLKLMRHPVFDRFFARCQQLLSEGKLADQEASEKNSSSGSRG